MPAARGNAAWTPDGAPHTPALFHPPAACESEKRQSHRLGAVPAAMHRGRYLCKSRGKAPQTQPRLLRSAKTTGLSKFAWLLPHSSLCEKLGDFWGGNGAFTQDAPAGFFISKV